ncbi:hypothetical protein ANRL2_01784 [Anaerolineae bacterium]|nr:hypothetical protein ANRL2_01784 [Anaerolineae bacterium]
MEFRETKFFRASLHCDPKAPALKREGGYAVQGQRPSSVSAFIESFRSVLHLQLRDVRRLHAFFPLDKVELEYELPARQEVYVHAG